MIYYYIFMARELFKGANAGTIKNVLQKAAGIPVENMRLFPKPYQVNEQVKDQWAKIDLEYSDFKEAFSRFNLITRACGQIDYYPEIFNVYNRISIRLYSAKDSEKALTVKDLYLSYFLNQLQSKTVNQSHKAAIEKVQSAS